MTHSPSFADRILNIAVTGPLVRIELATLELPKAEGQQPQLVPAQILIMPLGGFVATFGMLEAMMKKLLADGVLKQQTPTQTMGSQPAPATKQ